MANTITWYDSAETGAPVLNNAAGSLIALLDALLVTGFRLQTLTSISVTANVATCTLAGHGYATNRMLDIGGASTTAINGRKKITVTGSGTFTFPAPGVADGAVGGTITAKRSPLGWTRTHSAAATTGMYSRSDVTATAMSMRVDDTAAGAASTTSARAVMVESFTDINTFSGPAPLTAYSGQGVYFPKGVNDATAKPWLLVGDSRTFYLFTDSSGFPAASNSGALNGMVAFGDIDSHRAADAYGCLLAGASSASQFGSTDFGYTISLNSPPPIDAVVVSRAWTGIGSSSRLGTLGIRSAGRLGGSGPAYPSPVDNGLNLSRPLLLVESNTSFNYPIRGSLRGVADPLAQISPGLLHKQVLTGVIGSDRDWLMVAFQQSGNHGHAAFDITGPW